MKKQGLDPTDVRILSAVQAHGRLSKTKLAELVNLSPTPCWARLERLRTLGYIKGYHAQLEFDKICDISQVYVTVSLTHHRKSDFERFEKFVMACAEITDCVTTGGGMDYVLKVVTPSLVAFQQVMDDMLAADIGVDRYITHIVTRQVKSSQPDVMRLALGQGGPMRRP